MTQVYIGLGSNLNNPEVQLSNAIEALGNLPGSNVTACSSFYRSKPVGPQDQSDFINAVVDLDTDLTALALLDYIQGIEQRQGRIREQERWGPRTLDLDLLLYGEEQIKDDRLVVPHREMHKRSFVLLPLYELAPHMAIPGRGKVSELLNNMGTNGIEKIDPQ